MADFLTKLREIFFLQIDDRKGLSIYELKCNCQFQDCVKCLSEFGSNPNYPDCAMDAINLINTCAKYVSEHSDKFDSITELNSQNSSELQNNHQDHVPKSDRVWIRGWFPVIYELSNIINQSKLDVRTRSLTILFNIVQDYGESFESDNWTDLFNLLFR